MSPKIAFLLADPKPHSHIVFPSSNDNLISEAVGAFASSGLRKGDAVILVTTALRRGEIEHKLRAEGHDVESLQSSGQLAFMEAGELLSAFLEEGMPAAEKFKDAVGQVIDKASISPDTGQPRKVRIFGEMVSLLYMASNVPAAERLEEFWNELVKAYSVSLFCAYSLGLGPDSRLPQSLLDAHSHDLSVQ